MNYPTSDLQFIAQLLRRVRNSDQITHDESVRLDMIADNGFSSVVDAPPPDPASLRGDPSRHPVAEHPGATRVER